MGTYHARIINAFKDEETQAGAVLVGIVERQEKEQEAALFGAPLFTSYRDDAILSQIRPDGVIIATPTNSHYEIADYFLSQGIPVLIEKPITTSADLAQKLFDRAAEKNTFLHVGHVERYNKAWQKGSLLFLGTPENKIEAIITTRITTYAPRVAHESVVSDLLVHDLDLISRLLGEKLTLEYARGKKILSPETTDYATACFSTSSGVIYTATVGRTSAMGYRTALIIGSHATLEVNFGEQRLTYKLTTEAKKQSNITSAHPLEVSETFSENALRTELLLFVDSIASLKKTRSLSAQITPEYGELTIGNNESAEQMTAVLALIEAVAREAAA